MKSSPGQSVSPYLNKSLSQRERRREFNRKLAEVNQIVWKRDHCQCVNCGSGVIYGKPYRSGAHHIYSRTAHPEYVLDPDKMCLLCVECHNEYANTKQFAEKLIGILERKK